MLILLYSIPELRPTRDRSLTQVPPLCSPANDRFVDVLSLLPHCSLVLPLCSLVLPLSHFFLAGNAFLQL